MTASSWLKGGHSSRAVAGLPRRENKLNINVKWLDLSISFLASTEFGLSFINNMSAFYILGENIDFYPYVFVKTGAEQHFLAQ